MEGYVDIWRNIYRTPRTLHHAQAGQCVTTLLQRVHNMLDRPGVRFNCGAVSGEGACRREARIGWSGLDLQRLGRQERGPVQLMGQRSEGMGWPHCSTALSSWLLNPSKSMLEPQVVIIAEMLLGCWRVSTYLAAALTKHALLAAIEKPDQELALLAILLAAVVKLSSYTHGMESNLHSA